MCGYIVRSVSKWEIGLNCACDCDPTKKDDASCACVCLKKKTRFFHHQSDDKRAQSAKALPSIMVSKFKNDGSRGNDALYMGYFWYCFKQRADRAEMWGGLYMWGRPCG